jgi:hypothetical protein
LRLLTSACSPSTTETTANEVIDLVVSDEQLAPGTYARSDFTPRVTFEVSGEWYAVQKAAGFFDIQRDVGSPHVIALQFGNVEAVYGDDDERVPATSAAEAATIVGSSAQLTVLGQDGSRMGGLEGSVVVVENTGPTQARILDVPAGALAIDPGRRLWLALFDIEDGILAIMVGGSAERWEEALLAAEPILESVTIDS